jgi:hypothetical protein
MALAPKKTSSMHSSGRRSAPARHAGHSHRLRNTTEAISVVAIMVAVTATP